METAGFWGTGPEGTSWGRVTASAAQATPLHMSLPVQKCMYCSCATAIHWDRLRIKDGHPNGSLGQVRLFAVPCKSHAGSCEATEKAFV